MITQNLKISSSPSQSELVALPYYGAAKGQILQIRRNKDGIVSTEVIQQSPSNANNESTMPAVAPAPGFIYGELSDIQKAASDILSLQERMRLNERLTKLDHQLYMDQLKKMTDSGTHLVNMEHSAQSGM